MRSTAVLSKRRGPFRNESGSSRDMSKSAHVEIRKRRMQLEITIRRHISSHELDVLVGGERLAKLLPYAYMITRDLEAGLCCAEAARCDVDTTAIQASHGHGKPLSFLPDAVHDGNLARCGSPLSTNHWALGLRNSVVELVHSFPETGNIQVLSQLWQKNTVH